MPEHEQAATRALRQSASGYFIEATFVYLYEADTGSYELDESDVVAWTQRASVAARARTRVASAVYGIGNARRIGISVQVGDDAVEAARSQWHADIRRHATRVSRGGGLPDAAAVASVARPILRRIESEADADEARERIVDEAWRREARLSDGGDHVSRAVPAVPATRMIADVGQVLSSIHAILDAPSIDPDAYSDDEVIRWRTDDRARVLAFQEAAAPMLRWAVEDDCLNSDVQAGERDARFPMTAAWTAWTAWAAVGRGVSGGELQEVLRDAQTELMGVRGSLQMELAGEQSKADDAVGQSRLFAHDGPAFPGPREASDPRPPSTSFFEYGERVLDRLLPAMPRRDSTASLPDGEWYVWSRATDPDDAPPRVAINLPLARVGSRREAERLMAVLARANAPGSDGLPTFATFPVDDLDDADRVLLESELRDPTDADHSDMLRSDARRYLCAIRENDTVGARGPSHAGLVATIVALPPEAIDTLASLLPPEVLARLATIAAGGQPFGESQLDRPADGQARDCILTVSDAALLLNLSLIHI